MALDKKKTGALSVAGLGSAAALFALMDTRYAIATDVEVLVEALKEDRIERIEMQITESEDRESYLKTIPEAERTPYQTQDLYRQQNQKEAAVRKLDRINGEQ